MQLLAEKLINSLITLPTLTNWLEVFFLLLIYTVIILPIGLITKFLDYNWQKSPTIITKIVLTSLFTPAILEEIFFRVFLLPSPTEKISATTYLWIVVSLIMFIIYHPLNALTFFPAGRKTFFEPVFLFSAGLLGLICAIAYQKSGSLWLAVFVHWLIVVAWLIFLGGYERLNYEKKGIHS